MAILQKQDLKALSPWFYSVSGSFAPNTAADPATGTIEGYGFTVAHTSTGLFTLTLSEAFASFVSGVASLQLATAADQFCQIGTVSGKTVVISVWDVSDNDKADVAIDDNNRINFEFILSSR